MIRLIITFETLFQVLAADKVLRDLVSIRPVPTPPGLGSDICGVSLEVLDLKQQSKVEQLLEERQMHPKGFHHTS